MSSEHISQAKPFTIDPDEETEYKSSCERNTPDLSKSGGFIREDGGRHALAYSRKQKGQVLKEKTQAFRTNRSDLGLQKTLDLIERGK